MAPHRSRHDKSAPVPGAFQPAGTARAVATWGAAGVVFACALGVRLVVALDARDAPYWAAPTLDEALHIEDARRLLAGTPLAHGAHYMAPGYTWMLSAVFAAGGGIVAVKILNLVAGACSAALVAWLAQRSFGRAAGLAAGIAWALYPAELLQELLVLKSVWSVLLVLACLVLIPRESNPAAISMRQGRGAPSKLGAGLMRWAVAGLCMGCAALLRPELLVATGFLVAGAIAARVRAWPGSPRRLALGLFCAGVLGPVAVPTLQNLGRSGDLIVVAYGGGPNFYIGNHAGALGVYEPLRPDRGDPRLEEADAVQLASRAAGRPLSPAEVSRYWLRRGLAWWREQPADALRLTFSKWALLWGPRELADGVPTSLAARWVVALRSGVFFPALVLPAALVGLWLARRRRELWPTLALVLGLQIAIVPFFLFERFRLPLVAVSLPFAAAAGVAAWTALRMRAWRRLALGAAAVLATGGALAQVRVPIDEDVHRAHLGTMLYDAGRFAEAVHEFETVRAASPDYWRIDDNLAAAYAALHDYDNARSAVLRFLGHLVEEESATGMAPAEELTYAHDLAGEIERIRNEPAAAAEHFRTALQYASPQDRERLQVKLDTATRLRIERENATHAPRGDASWHVEAP